jgi:hypothetical protein
VGDAVVAANPYFSAGLPFPPPTNPISEEDWAQLSFSVKVKTHPARLLRMKGKGSSALREWLVDKYGIDFQQRFGFDEFFLDARGAEVPNSLSVPVFALYIDNLKRTGFDYKTFIQAYRHDLITHGRPSDFLAEHLIAQIRQEFDRLDAERVAMTRMATEKWPISREMMILGMYTYFLPKRHCIK